MTRKVADAGVQFQPQREVFALVRVEHSETHVVELVQLIHEAFGVDLAVLDLAANVRRSSLKCVCRSSQ
jgi:hypothetical protein